ncbi:MAG: NAD(P)H-binding protein, partial [Gammaproteobacteria bacterium]
QGDFIVKLIQKISLRHTLADKEQQEKLIITSDLDWTLIRPARLMNGNSRGHPASWVGPQHGKIIWSINRTAVAEIALDALRNTLSIGLAINAASSAEIQSGAG